MQARIKRLFAQVAWAAIASWLLMVLASQTVRTKFEPLAIRLFFEPGMIAAAKVFPSAYFGNGKGHMPNVGLGLILNFVIIWIVLLFVVKLFELLISTMTRKTVN
ncbi:MAG: hypothetical protein ABR991_00860 [Terracidiphilus sp.]|jgi:hypothetical protein